jgi:hypothetical protein
MIIPGGEDGMAFRAGSIPSLTHCSLSAGSHPSSNINFCRAAHRATAITHEAFLCVLRQFCECGGGVIQLMDKGQHARLFPRSHKAKKTVADQ